MDVIDDAFFNPDFLLNHYNSVETRMDIRYHHIRFIAVSVPALQRQLHIWQAVSPSLA